MEPRHQESRSGRVWRSVAHPEDPCARDPRPSTSRSRPSPSRARPAARPPTATRRPRPPSPSTAHARPSANDVFLLAQRPRKTQRGGKRARTDQAPSYVPVPHHLHFAVHPARVRQVVRLPREAALDVDGRPPRPLGRRGRVGCDSQRQRDDAHHLAERRVLKSAADLSGLEMYIDVRRTPEVGDEPRLSEKRRRRARTLLAVRRESQRGELEGRSSTLTDEISIIQPTYTPPGRYAVRGFSAHTKLYPTPLH